MHDRYMQQAIMEAQKAYMLDEVPIGAVIVLDGQIIGRGKNDREATQSSLGHAEINAIIDASRNTKSWKLNNATMYVTMEPCLMCYGAIKQARIKNVFFGTKELSIKKNSYRNFLAEDQSFFGGICEEATSDLMKKFFLKLRS